MTDISDGANISMKSAFEFRVTAIIDKRLSVDRRRTSQDYDWCFMYFILKKASLSQV